jgi:hypothetical protein
MGIAAFESSAAIMMKASTLAPKLIASAMEGGAWCRDASMEDCSHEEISNITTRLQ